MALNWLVTLVGDAAFPWVAGGLFGAAFGAWSIALATRTDRTRPSRTSRFLDLADFIQNVKTEWMEGLREEDGSINFQKKNYQTSLRLKALYAELRKVGLHPPDYDRATAIEYNVGHHHYLQVLEPFAARGLLAEAKGEAKKAMIEFRAAVQQNQLPAKIEAETLR